MKKIATILMILVTILLMVTSCIPAQDFNPSHIEEKEIFFSDFKINIDSVLYFHPDAKDGDTIYVYL